MRKALFCFYFLVSSISLSGFINQNNDIQLWITEELYKNISSCSFLSLANEWRIGNNVSQLYFFYLQGILGYKIHPQADLGLGYRQIWHLLDDRWRLIYEPFVECLLYKTVKKHTFDFRNRIAYRMRESQENIWQYRGRVRWIESWEIAHRTFQPYLSNEIFVESSGGFNQDRLGMGIIYPFLDRLRGTFYFMLRFQKFDHEWRHHNVFGFWLTLQF